MIAFEKSLIILVFVTSFCIGNFIDTAEHTLKKYSDMFIDSAFGDQSSDSSNQSMVNITMTTMVSTTNSDNGSTTEITKDQYASSSIGTTESITTEVSRADSTVKSSTESVTPKESYRWSIVFGPTPTVETRPLNADPIDIFKQWENEKSHTESHTESSTDSSTDSKSLIPDSTSHSTSDGVSAITMNSSVQYPFDRFIPHARDHAIHDHEIDDAHENVTKSSVTNPTPIPESHSETPAPSVSSKIGLDFILISSLCFLRLI